MLRTTHQRVSNHDRILTSNIFITFATKNVRISNKSKVLKKTKRKDTRGSEAFWDLDDVATLHATSAAKFRKQSLSSNSLDAMIKSNRLIRLPEQSYSRKMKRWYVSGRNKENNIPRTERNVTFRENVEITLIPTWKDYPHATRKDMWCNCKEIKQMKKKNMIEYVADGCDWRNVTEDEDMAECRKTGNRIHPVHQVGLKRATSSHRSSTKYSTAQIKFNGHVGVYSYRTPKMNDKSRPGIFHDF